MNSTSLSSREFRSANGVFSAVVSSHAFSQLLQHAAKSGTLETGGIAMGRYSDDHSCAMVDQFTGPPEDSQHGRFSFVRGVKGLQSMISRMWSRERCFYLGEWHYHPMAAAEPSMQDLSQMMDIASNVDYACPEVLLFILGGDANGTWELRVFLTYGKRTLELNAAA